MIFHFYGSVHQFVIDFKSFLYIRSINPLSVVCITNIPPIAHLSFVSNFFSCFMYFVLFYI